MWDYWSEKKYLQFFRVAKKRRENVSPQNSLKKFYPQMKWETEMHQKY